MKARLCCWTLTMVAAVSLGGCDSGEDPVGPPPAAPATVPAEVADDADARAGETMEVDEATRVKFNTLVEQVTAHIRNREFDAAETGLGELDKMRGTVDDAMKQQIETARAALTAARAAPAGAAAK